MVAPPQNLHFSKKHWFLQCFRHILTSRFGKLRLGGHISSSYIKIYDIHCTTKKCGMFRNTSVSKTEKLKNWKTVFSRDIQGEILHKKTVFQFFSFSVLSPEMFRKSSVSKTEKLKNWKTVFSRGIQGEILHKKTVFQFFSFAYGSIPEEFRRQNWKTEKLFFSWRISPWISLEKTVFQFFSFAYGTLPEHFRRQNWKTEKLFFYGESLPGSLWKKTVFQFFSFAYGTLPEHTTFFSRAVYVIYFYIWARYVTPQTKLTKSRGQNVPETL